MKTLRLNPVVHGFGKDRGPVGIDEAQESAKTFELWIDADGSLTAVVAADLSGSGMRSDATRIGVLRCRQESNEQVWYLVRHTNQLSLNGLMPPPLLAQLRPGTLLSCGERF